jgi:D-beta-D-heptose 7-phosphate kinase/D-beta-D-heptose 1-phosphate adenosyltransferase
MSQRRAGAKVLPTEELVRRFGPGRSEKLVFTNGCFDLLHVGHATYLEQARVLGDVLVVAVNSDASAAALDKGPGRPFVSAADRARLVASLESVDAVTIFDDATPAALVRALLPNILVKGTDYTIEEVVGRDVVEAAGGRVELIPIVRGRSSTELIERIQTEGRS